MSIKGNRHICHGFGSIYLADGDIRSIVWQSSCENISWEDKLLLGKNYEGGFWLGIEELAGIY